MTTISDLCIERAREDGLPWLVLAPMAGITDAPFRLLAQRFGADMTVSEMLASQAMIRYTAKSLKIASSAATEHPFIVQIAGADPAAMAEAARFNADQGAEAIDINMGCPVKKIVKSGSGAALMRDPELAARIVEAVVGAVSIPVSVKMRLGWDESRRNGVAMARLLESSGARWLAVHGRTRAQMYGGRADWDAIGEIKRSVGIPVIGNGDVKTPEDALRMVTVAGVDGVMVGRACLGRPWLFGQIRHFLTHGVLIPGPSLLERFAVMRDHFHGLLAHHGEVGGYRSARKHLAWYTRGFVGGARFRDAVNHTNSAAETEALLERFCAEVLEAGRRGETGQEEGPEMVQEEGFE